MKTKRLQTSDAEIIEAAEFIKNGEVVAFPTETVYGLGSSLSIEGAEKLYDLKKRPLEKPFTLHISSWKILKRFVLEIPKSFYPLKEAFLPGPLTLIFPLKPEKLLLKFFPLKTIGVRFPKDSVAEKLIEASGQAILGTSANFSSKLPAIDIEMLKPFDGKIAAILDGKKTEYQQSSTVLTLFPEVKILRKGVISKEEIEKVLKLSL